MYIDKKQSFFLPLFRLMTECIERLLSRRVKATEERIETKHSFTQIEFLSFLQRLCAKTAVDKRRAIQSGGSFIEESLDCIVVEQPPE